MGATRTFRSTMVAAIALVAIGHLSPVAAQRQYRVSLDADRLVKFTSRASIEEFDGVTDKIDGLVTIDTDRVTTETGGDDTELYFEVDLASLDTGIGLRNRHMRDNYLEVEEHPFAAFGGRIARAAPLDGGAFRVTTQGTFGVHGVERDRSFTCDISPVGEMYRVQCEFTVLLEEHNIEIPKVMFLKLNNEIQLTLDFHVEPVEGNQ